ncbi:hypothetical protein C8F04DRAFT_1137764 [Mycena alexandri]|uniref:Uncharacterized protein n=1 Tax=Mycena alexandri TaxID=1745969 RepID=A0AAD6SAA2_9AGAR|nr:hypothetical protein C8F04DRAFT_1137764 [Mycena alexandri]
MLPFTSLTIFTLSLAISPASAIIISNNGHRSTTSRIIGAVIAVVIFLALLTILCVARRRRARAGGPLLGGFAPGSTGAGKFGGFNRWGQGNTHNQNQGAYQTGGQPSYFPGGHPAGAKNPPGDQVPPPYTSTGAFSAPTGPPPDNAQQGTYAAPPGPPPQAHVNVCFLHLSPDAASRAFFPGPTAE